MGARRHEIIDGLHALPDQIRMVLANDKQFQDLGYNTLVNEKSLLIMGRGYQHATCLEGELKHGPLALIDEAMAVILIMTKDSLYPKVQTALSQVSARNGRPIIICNDGDTNLPNDARVLRVPMTV